MDFGNETKQELNAPSLFPSNVDEAAINKSTSADQFQEVHDHQAPEL